MLLVRLLAGREQHASLLVLVDLLLEEVRLLLERYELHPIEGVLRAEALWLLEGGEQPVRYKLDALRFIPMRLQEGASSASTAPRMMVCATSSGSGRSRIE